MDLSEYLKKSRLLPVESLSDALASKHVSLAPEFSLAQLADRLSKTVPDKRMKKLAEKIELLPELARMGVIGKDYISQKNPVIIQLIELATNAIAVEKIEEYNYLKALENSGVFQAEICFEQYSLMKDGCFVFPEHVKALCRVCKIIKSSEPFSSCGIFSVKDILETDSDSKEYCKTPDAVAGEIAVISLPTGSMSFNSLSSHFCEWQKTQKDYEIFEKAGLTEDVRKKVLAIEGLKYLTSAGRLLSMAHYDVDAYPKFLTLTQMMDTLKHPGGLLPSYRVQQLFEKYKEISGMTFAAVDEIRKRFPDFDEELVKVRCFFNILLFERIQKMPIKKHLEREEYEKLQKENPKFHDKYNAYGLSSAAEHPEQYVYEPGIVSSLKEINARIDEELNNMKKCITQEEYDMIIQSCVSNGNVRISSGSYVRDGKARSVLSEILRSPTKMSIARI
ncbi:hypothetical protein HY486_01115 [Candidatus Woesearchaeota archaeon]|nr:hypothetical protein [Candidatus Woesearchaeota archaeon]